MNNASLSNTARSRRSCGALASLSLLVALVPVIGCGGEGAGERVDVGTLDNSVTGPGFGVDYAWARPSPASLKADGFGFVARYLSYDTTGKNLSAGEANALIAEGLDVVADWEWGAQDALQGYALGVQEAQAAEAQAKADGQPAGRPIYFSIDFDAQPSQQGAINDYFDGVASVIGRARTGRTAARRHQPPLRRREDRLGMADLRVVLRPVGSARAAPPGRERDRAGRRDGQRPVDGRRLRTVGTREHERAAAAASPALGPPTGKPAATSGCGTIQPRRGADQRGDVLVVRRPLLGGDADRRQPGALPQRRRRDLGLEHQRERRLRGHHADRRQLRPLRAPLERAVELGHGGPPRRHAGRAGGRQHGRLRARRQGGVGHRHGVPLPPPAPSGCGEILAGQGLTAGDSYSSCGGEYTLAMQNDGNLVLYHNGRGAIWATMTNGKGGFNMWMQTDGNFVLYNTTSAPLWNSVTEGHGGAFLAVQSDGNLVVYAPGNTPIWASGTNGK